MGHRFVAANAVVDHDIATGFGNLNWFVEVLKGEALGVAVAMLSFDKVFADDRVVGHVAVVAGGAGVVGRIGPGVVLIVHDVTIDAGLWVI